MHRNQLNFSGGPGALPEEVLQELQQAVLEVPGVGLSILGISHRSDWFKDLVLQTEAQVKQLMGLGAEHHVLFLQGGATQQFSMVPMAFLATPGSSADYLCTGYWSQKSVQDVRHHGQHRLLWDGQASGFTRLPRADELAFNPDAAYLHYVSNETVEGLQHHQPLGLDSVPRVCDMSSDFLSRPLAADRFALMYAHAQKNLGPAGVTVVVLHEAMLQKAHSAGPGFLSYPAQAAAHSNFNTPPVMAIYVVHLVLRWLQETVGGLANMGRINQAKASALYTVIDQSQGFYRGRAAVPDRSLMNVCFRLSSPEREAEFLAQAQAAGFSGLAGHRSAGGLRASLYNGLSLEAALTLAGFMQDFSRRG